MCVVCVCCVSVCGVSVVCMWCVCVCVCRRGERENRCGKMLAGGGSKWRECGYSLSSCTSVSQLWPSGARGIGPVVLPGAELGTELGHLCPVCSSPPIHMKVQPLNQTALQVSWGQPETIYHPPIMNYMVSYSWTKNEDEKEKTFTKDSDKDLVRPPCSESGRPRQ